MMPRFATLTLPVALVALSVGCSDERSGTPFDAGAGRDAGPRFDGSAADAARFDGGPAPVDAGCRETPERIAEICPELRYCLVADLACGSTDCVYRPRDCDDGDLCTADSCHDDTRSCGHEPTVPFGATERGSTDCANGIDDDCDGLIDMQETSCGGCAVDTECDDTNVCTDDRCVTNACVHDPAATVTTCDDADACTTGDRCSAGSCTGDIPDADGDGHGVMSCGGDDCADDDATRHPGRLELPGPLCSDGLENDCDGGIDLFDRGCNAMCLRSWCWSNPLVHGWYVTSSTAEGALPWFGTMDGVTVRWTGTRWEPFDTGTTARIDAIWARTSSDAWAVGAAGLVTRFDGTSWTVVTPPTTLGLRAVAGRAADDVWVGGAMGAVFSWNGTSWTDRSIASGAGVNGLTVLADGRVFAATTTGISSWNGTGWTVVVAGSFQFMSQGAGGDIWAAGGPGVYRFTGGAWGLSAGAPAEVDSLWAGTDGTVLTRDLFVTSADYYRFDGTSWREITGVSTSARIAGVSGTEVWLASTTGAMWRHNGTSYTVFSDGAGPRGLSEERTLHEVFALRADRAWASGEHGTVMEWNGSAWRELPENLHRSNTSTIEHHNYDVWAAAEDDVVIVGGATRGGNGFVERWNGTAWMTLAESTSRLRAVWGTASDNLWIAGAGGVQRWDGTALSVPPGGATTGELQDVAGRSADDVWLGGGSTLLHWNGTVLAPETLPCGPVSVRDVEVTSDGVLWVGVTATGTSHDCPGTGSTVLRRTGPGAWTYGPWEPSARDLFAAAPNDVWFAAGDDLLQWTGSAWSRFAREASEIESLGGLASGPLWAVAGIRSIRLRQGR